MAVQATNLKFDYSKYGFRDEENYVFKSGKGLNEGVVRELSGMKGEPERMLKRRLQALEIFRKKPVPLKSMWANEELAANSRITNKSVSKDGGKTTYRGLAKVARGATDSKINVNCDALILDDRSSSDTIPFIEIEEDRTTLAHEASVGRIGAEQLFYLMSRGLPQADALSMIVLGFMEPFTRELPMEYAVELNRLIQLEMEGSVG